MFGFLNIDKPKGITSRDAVNQVQRLVRPHKIGHAGTLDPLATGVLVVAIGPATRLVDYVHRHSKWYDATFLMGRASDTEDVTGHVVELAGARRPEEAELRAAMARFVGAISQKPPAFSALKVRGLRAYDLARRGEQVSLDERLVHIHTFELLSYEYPQLKLRIECATGTYVRSLGRDLAESLGTSAVMSALTRTAVGPFRLVDCLSLDSLDAQAIGSRLTPPSALFSKSQTVVLGPDDVRRVRLGQSLEWPSHGRTGDLAAVDATGRLVCVLARRDADWLRPVLNFPRD